MKLIREAQFKELRFWGYDPAEARDDRGRWTDTGGGTSGPENWDSGKPAAAKLEVPLRPADIPQPSVYPLTLDQRAVEARFAEDIHSNFWRYKQEYKEKFGNVLNADNAKELSADYRRDRTSYAPAVHEPASWFIKKLYEDELAKPAPEGKANFVLFTAGGAGSGKTTAVEGDARMNSLRENSQVVFDATLRDPNSSAKKIQQALDAGKRVAVVFVYRDPVEAFRNGVLPRAATKGRTVLMEEHAAQHENVQESMRNLAARYKDNPDFSMIVLDNSHGKGNAQVSTLNLLPKTDSGRVLREKLRSELDSAYARGVIDEKLYKTTLGQTGSPSKAAA